MNKPLSKLLLAAGVAMSAFILIDFVSWLISGLGIFEQMFGVRTPLLRAIADILGDMPVWEFFLISAAAVVVLSSVIAFAIVALYRKELTS
jgi:hypothetical protein